VAARRFNSVVSGRRPVALFAKRLQLGEGRQVPRPARRPFEPDQGVEIHAQAAHTKKFDLARVRSQILVRSAARDLAQQIEIAGSSLG
jgi:hypothetical protein